MPGDGHRREARGLNAYRWAIVVFGLLFIGLGLAIVAVTAAHGGGLGLVIGPLFVLLGAGRLYLLRQRR